jgi:cell division protein ZapA
MSTLQIVEKGGSMEAKKYTEVYIAGKVYTLGGFEEEEYLQKLAAYVNSKVTELRGQQGFLKLNADDQNVLLNLNLADDIFKVRRQVAATEKKLTVQEQEAYHVKHDMVGIQIKMDGLKEELQSARQETEETAKALEYARTQLEELHSELEDTRSMLREAETELEEAKKQVATMEKRLAKTENKPKLLK